MTTLIDAKLIDGSSHTVREMFTGRKYGLDFYQREYTWTETNVLELVDDLTGAFLADYADGDAREKVASYRPYFLGPVVTSRVGNVRYLVDGQQRLTTLTLLLIHLNRLATGRRDADDLAPLVYSSQYGQKSFNLDVPDREQVMAAILAGHDFDTEDASESCRNIWDRYNDIVTSLSDEVTGVPLLHFCDWLLERVVLVEIGTTDQDMALEIFETMNDRGLRLSNTDMLKSFLIARMEDPAGDRDREQAVARPGGEAHRGGAQRGRGVPQGVAARQVRRHHPRAEEGRGTAGLRPHRYRVPQVGPGQPGPAGPGQAQAVRRLRQHRLRPDVQAVPEAARRLHDVHPRVGVGVLQRPQRADAAVPADHGRRHPRRRRPHVPGQGRVDRLLPGPDGRPAHGQLPQLRLLHHRLHDVQPGQGLARPRPGRRAQRPGRPGRWAGGILQRGHQLRAHPTQPVPHRVPPGPDDRVARGRARGRRGRVPQPVPEEPLRGGAHLGQPLPAAHRRVRQPVRLL